MVRKLIPELSKSLQMERDYEKQAMPETNSNELYKLHFLAFAVRTL